MDQDGNAPDLGDDGCEMLPEACDERAFVDQLLDLIPDLQRTAVALTRNMDGADDLVQTTLVKALGAMSGFSPGAAVRPWLMAILRNAHKSRASREHRLEFWGDSLPEVPFEDNLDVRLDLLKAQHGLEALPAGQRRAFTAVIVLGYSHEEASRQLGCSIGTVKSRVSRARANLATDMSSGRLPQFRDLQGSAEDFVGRIAHMADGRTLP